MVKTFKSGNYGDMQGGRVWMKGRKKGGSERGGVEGACGQGNRNRVSE